MIKVENVSKHYGIFKGNKKKVLKDVSLSINKGEITGIVGGNGSGKTTLLRIIAGLIPPSSGKVTIGGYKHYINSPQLHNTIGYLPENSPSINEHTVYNFLIFSARLRLVSDIKRTVLDVAEQCGVTDLLQKKYNSLSKGQKRSVLLAAILLHNPEILILDEPTEGLDNNYSNSFKNIISSFKKDKTIIIVSHIIEDIDTLCDKALILIKGRVVFDEYIDKNMEKDFKEIYKDYLFKEATHY